MSETPFSHRRLSRGPLPSRLEAAAEYARQQRLEQLRAPSQREFHADLEMPLSVGVPRVSRMRPATDMLRPAYKRERPHSEEEFARFNAAWSGTDQGDDAREAFGRQDEREVTGKYPAGLVRRKMMRVYGDADKPFYQSTERGGETHRGESSELFSDQDVDSQDIAFELDRELARLEARQRDLEADRHQEELRFKEELARLEEELRAEEPSPRFDLRAKHRPYEGPQPWLEEVLDRDELRDRIPSSGFGHDDDARDRELERLSRRLPPQGTEADAF